MTTVRGKEVVCGQGPRAHAHTPIVIAKVGPNGAQSESMSVSLLFARFGSATPLGTLTVAVLKIEPVAHALIVPVAIKPQKSFIQ